MHLLKVRVLLDTVLGIAALVISVASFLYARGQAQDIRTQADATKQQVEVMRQQLEMAKSEASNERNYAAVLSRASFDALTAPLTNRKSITLKYTNRSAHTQSYEIKVKSSGFGVCPTRTTTRSLAGTTGFASSRSTWCATSLLRDHGWTAHGHLVHRRFSEVANGSWSR